MRAMWMRLGLVAVIGLVASAGCACAGVARAAEVRRPTVTLKASRASVPAGHPVTISGSVIGERPNGGVVLYERRYPYRVMRLVGRTVTDASGSFSFTVAPDRDALYSAILVGARARAVVRITVIARTITKLRALSLGRAKVTLIVFH